MASWGKYAATKICSFIFLPIIKFYDAGIAAAAALDNLIRLQLQSMFTVEFSISLSVCRGLYKYFIVGNDKEVKIKDV